MNTAKNRLLEQFLLLRAAPDLLATRWWGRNPCKEITESMAALVAVRGMLGVEAYGDRQGLAVVIGDGTDPRTGALFAMVTRWEVISIDPSLRADTSKVERLTGVTCKVEDYVPTERQKHRRVVFVLVHSHGVLTKAVIDKFEPSSFCVFSMPCCTNDVDFGEPCDSEFDEDHCISDKRHVRLWNERRWLDPEWVAKFGKPVDNGTFERLRHRLTIPEEHYEPGLLLCGPGRDGEAYDG